MDLEIAKTNRLKRKFNFNGRDWRYELDGYAEELRHRTIERVRPEVVWERGQDDETQTSLAAETQLDF